MVFWSLKLALTAACWRRYADFEAREDVENARAVIGRGERMLKDQNENEARFRTLHSVQKCLWCSI